jgi:integrase
MSDELTKALVFDEEQTAALMSTARDAENFVKHARADNTRAAYRSDWQQFSGWIEAHGLDALPADPRMVALWLTHMAQQLGRKRSTIKRMMATISVAHRRAGHPSPCDSELVREAYRGICNVLAKREGTQGRQKHAAPLLIDHLEAVIAAMGDDLRACRNRAAVLVGWSGALRRSEIADLRVEDLAFMDKGVRLLIRRSKTDQGGDGQHVAIFHATREALCPVRALRRWLADAQLTEGFVFRRLTTTRPPRVLDDAVAARTIDRWVRTHAARASVQPEQSGQSFSAHSLRAGFVTEAARASKAEWSIAKQSRHRSAEVLRGYIRVATVFEGNAAEGLL